MKYFTDDIVRNRPTIARLAEKIRNCMLVHLDDAEGISPARARWRRRRSGAEWRWATSVFTRPERGNDTELSVDILLDASASQIKAAGKRLPRRI